MSEVKRRISSVVLKNAVGIPGMTSRTNVTIDATDTKYSLSIKGNWLKVEYAKTGELTEIPISNILKVVYRPE